MTYEQRARADGWKPLSVDIAELVDIRMVFGVSYFHKNGSQGDLTYSCDTVGESAWHKLCKEEGLE